MNVSFELGEEQDYRVTRVPISRSGVLAALQSAASSGYKLIGRVSHLDGKPVTLAVADKRALLGIELDGFPLATHAALKEGVLLPVFKANKDSVPATLQWKVPETMQLTFACLGERLANGNWKDVNCFLFARHRFDTPGGYFRFVLPNIFEDGRLCMGNSYSNTQANLLDLLPAALAHFRASAWNTDLLPASLTDTHKLFRFDPTSFQSVPCMGDWWAACKRVSRTEYDMLTEGSQAAPVFGDEEEEE